jgi:hypothetical protein
MSEVLIYIKRLKCTDETERELLGHKLLRALHNKCFP